eukprot:1439521-Prorocentrum_lima.AAC.1
MLGGSDWIPCSHPLINWVPGDSMKLIAILFIQVGHWQAHWQDVLSGVLAPTSVQTSSDFPHFTIQMLRGT